MDYHNNDSGCVINNNLPAVIYVASPEKEINIGWEKKGAKDLEKLKSTGISIESIQSLQEKNIEFPLDITEGCVLVRNPYSKAKYIRIEDVRENADEKLFIYKKIFELLGAKHYEIVSAKETIKTRKRTFMGKIKWKAIKGRADVDIIESWDSKYKIESKSDLGGVSVVSQESYNEAQHLIDANNLRGDKYITGLVESRNPERKNLKKKDELFASLFDDYNKSIEVAGNIELAKTLAVSGKVKESTREKVETTLKISVEFP